MKRLLLTLVLAAALAPSAAQAAHVYVQVGPPAAIVEKRVVSPGPHYVWVGGYHRWNGNAYVWVPGQWSLPPAHFRTWAPGHWVHEPHQGWYWVDGHWRH